ncbi:unnamed protein product [Cladocopium goreaui]|uniref:Uncharacterized protein n=1 Tax=Cladocopium goreaui TaxID=2562237 RepID=A0A9P1BIZ6_9DINO|nr:unnamed protein product [Cladocopium goreaui]
MAQPKCGEEVAEKVNDNTNNEGLTMWAAAWRGGRVGALFVGAISAVLGLLLGSAAGAAAGSLLAPLTLGFSAPACCFFGALGGLILGAALGCAGGVMLGASLGLLCFATEMPSGWTKPRNGQVLQVAAPLILTGVTGPCFASFGAFLGLLSGAFLGLIAGLFLAPFTFGISVPICACLGGIVGAAVDAATGALLAVLLNLVLFRHRSGFMGGLTRLFQPFITAFNRWRFQLAMLIAPSLEVALKNPDESPMEARDCKKPARRARRRARKVGNSIM